MEKTINEIRDFNRFYTMVIGVVNEHILESEYSLTEVRVMFEIYNNDEMTVRKLRDILELDEGYLSRLISKLEKLKVVKKTKSKEDSRIYSLSLTSKGENIYLALDRKSSDSVKKLISHLSDKEKSDLINNMNKIRSYFLRK